MLQAETYAAGRLTNPPHPQWQHFESFHVNQQPTYSSIFFPGRGLPLAIGDWLGIGPWPGVWLSAVLMSVSLCWMLQAWVPFPYALLGGVLVVLRYGVFSYWVNSYWGGAFTALGGALVLGALPRILRTLRWRDGLLLGCGAAILMTTRPFEGALLCLPTGLVLLAALLRQRGAMLDSMLLRIALPAAALILVATGVTLAYNSRTTGHALLTPYAVNRATYAIAPPFLVSQPIQAHAFPSERMHKFYDWEAENYARRNSMVGLAEHLFSRLRQFWMFYLGPALTIPFLAGLSLFRKRRVQFLAGTGLLVFAGILLETWGYAHYLAPATAVVFGITMLGFARLRSWQWRGQPSGLFLARTLPLACAAVLILPLSHLLLGWPPMPNGQGKHFCCSLDQGSERSRIAAELASRPKEVLALVHDDPDVSIHDEWVYNSANIDAARVVWALDLGADANRPLLEYYPDREVWLVHRGRVSVTVMPYPVDQYPEYLSVKLSPSNRTTGSRPTDKPGQ